MTLRRGQIVDALLAVVAGLVGPEIGATPSALIFPPDIAVDASGFEGWRDLDPAGALTDSANILSGKFEVTINAGPDSQWEGVRDCTVSYAVTGADKDARAARRDLVVPALELALAADRTMGTGDPQVWAEIGETTEDDDSPLADAGPISIALIAVNITYVAASAAG